MEQPSMGISYYHAMEDEFYSSETDEDVRNYLRLHLELLIEHEDRYRARANYLLKNHILQMDFKNTKIEFFIADRLVHFSIRMVDDNSFQDLSASALPRKKKDKIVALTHFFAQSEARMILEH